MCKVNCTDDTCAFFQGGKCGKEEISIEPTPTRDFRDGNRVVPNACQDYKEIGYDGTD